MRSRFRTMLVASLAVFAVGAVASASASAKNPTWMVCKGVSAGSGKFEDGLCSKGGKGNWEASELLAGETKGIEATSSGRQEFTLSGLGITLMCNLKTKAGAKLIGGEPGAVEETIVYERCEVKGFEKCLINNERAGEAQITTNALTAKEVFLSKKGAETESPEETGTLLKPKTGKVWASVTFKSEKGESSCPTFLEGTGREITGEVLAENVKSGVHATTQQLSFPVGNLATYWVQVGKTPVEEKVSHLRLREVNLGWFGKVNVKVTTGEAFWVF